MQLNSRRKINLVICLCRTPLHYATANNHQYCVMSLVHAGADVNAIDSRGCSPLHYAAAFDPDAKLVIVCNRYEIANVILGKTINAEG